MSERATVFENVQLGKESTAARGTSVAASRLLKALMIEFSQAMTSRRIRPAGNKLDTSVAPGRRSGEGSLQESAATFEEVCYPLESIFGVVTPTTPGGATATRQRVYSMLTRAPDNFQTYTLEKGSAAGASKMTFATFTAFNMAFETEEVTISGNIIGQKPTRGITMTPTPTALPMTVMDPLTVKVSVDPTFANIGTTTMLRVLSGNFGISDKYTPLWVINRLNGAGWPAVVERPIDATLGLVLSADSQSNQFLTQFDAGSVAYVRMEVQGALIEATQNYLFQADFAAAVESLSEGDQDDVWADTWGFRMVDDTNIPGVKITVKNTVTAL